MLKVTARASEGTGRYVNVEDHVAPLHHCTATRWLTTAPLNRRIVFPAVAAHPQ